MIFFTLGVNEYVIDEDYHELIEEVHEYFVHHMHEEGSGVGETKRHNCIFIKNVSSGECGLRNILLLDFELVISGPQINLGEYFCPAELIKQIINSWEWIFVINSDIVQLTVIHTHSQTAILLVHEYCG